VVRFVDIGRIVDHHCFVDIGRIVDHHCFVDIGRIVDHHCFVDIGRIVDHHGLYFFFHDHCFKRILDDKIGGTGRYVFTAITTCMNYLSSNNYMYDLILLPTNHIINITTKFRLNFIIKTSNLFVSYRFDLIFVFNATFSNISAVSLATSFSGGRSRSTR
jgi:hypothetical protein